MIPRKISFVWVGPPMPAWAERNIEEFRRLNPEHEIKIHGEESLHPDYLPLLENCGEPCERADLIRYSVLEKTGGWYFDVDYWPFRPLADIERAYSLGGDEIFLAEVWPSKANPGWLGNGVLASSAGNPLWARIRALALSAVPDGRLTYGPRLVRRLYDEEPERFILAPEPWFNGPKAEWSSRLYRSIVATGNNSMMRNFDPRTGGQLPYAMHLWAWKYSQELERPREFKNEPPIRLGVYGKGNKRNAAVITLPGYKFDAPGSLFTDVGKGLEKLGYQVEMLALDTRAMASCREIPEVIVAWNGLRESAETIITEARRLGARTLLMEMGFWQRNKYTQIDHRGTQHRASWAQKLRTPAPPEGAERLAKFYPDGIKPVRARKGGYILIIGQVALDTQLSDSEIQGPLPLQRAVKGAIPAGMEVFFRPHPQCSNVLVPANKQIFPVLGTPADAAAYRTTKGGPGLIESLERARFCITINSTAGNEILAAGIPVLALGPSLYNIAGVARPATIKTLTADVRAMLDGWCPDQDAVENYLRWLACRQFNPDEFAEGSALRGVLAAAGVTAPIPADGGAS